MNRRSLFATLLAAPAVFLASFRSMAHEAVSEFHEPLKLTNEQLRGEPCFPKPNLYRSGMRLRFTGRPPEHGRWAAHSATLAPGCIVDADTGESVTNIESLVISASGNAWMDAVVTTVDRKASMGAHRLVRRRGNSPISLDLVVRSESVADHAERVKRMEEAIHAADGMAKRHVVIDDSNSLVRYNDARKALDELGGIA